MWFRWPPLGQPQTWHAHHYPLLASRVVPLTCWSMMVGMAMMVPTSTLRHTNSSCSLLHMAAARRRRTLAVDALSPSAAQQQHQEAFHAGHHKLAMHTEKPNPTRTSCCNKECTAQPSTHYLFVPVSHLQRLSATASFLPVHICTVLLEQTSGYQRSISVHVFMEHLTRSRIAVITHLERPRP